MTRRHGRGGAVLRRGTMTVMAAGLVLIGTTVASAQVRWRNGVAPQSGKSPSEVIDTLASVGQRSAERHFVVQFSEPVTDTRRAELAAAGVELLGSLGDNAFFAAVAPAGADAAALAAQTTLIDAQSIQRQWKLHPALEELQTPEWAVVPTPDEAVDPQPEDVWIAAYVLFHPDVPALNAWEVATSAGAVVRQQLFSVNGAVIELPEIAIDALAAADAVQYIEPALPRMGANNAENRVLSQANVVQAAPYSLTGDGVNVLVYDGGTARSTHVDFQGRLTVRDSSGQHYHSTHVAGTIGGGGVAVANNKGMAPGVTMQSYGLQSDGSGIFLYTNPGDIESDFNEAINTYGAVISNASIGTNTAANFFDCALEGDYGVTDTVIDAITRGSLGAPFRMVWANGNERGNGRCGTTYRTTAPPACAKNHITVGALNANDDSITSFTSWGPADDGRLKPDISGPGCQSNGDGGVTSCDSASNTAYAVLCGTSMAAPTVTGCSALLIQDFKVQYPGQPLFRNSTLKAWLAHSAQDRGNTGPDYQFGYGSIRTQAAIDLMRSGAFTENSVSQGVVYSRTVVISAGDPELKVTLAWDDPPGTPNVSPALVNDLDLRVFAPGGAQSFPWTLGGIANPSAAAVRTQANHIDNIEQVLVNNPAAGVWTIEVYGNNVPQGPQTFSLVGDGAVNVGATISFPNGVPTIIAPGATVQLDVQIVAIGESIVAGSPTLHYRFDGGAFLTLPLTFVSGDLYQVTLPAPNCGDTPELYITASASITGAIASPGNAPAGVYSADVGTFVNHLTHTMEADLGWTVGDTGDNATTGIWTRNDPQATAAQPGDDHTPAPGVNCWVTNHLAGSGVGANDVDGGKTTLKSPTYDLTGTTRPIFGYWRWYSNDEGDNASANVFLVDVSNNNGSSWVNAETVGPAAIEASGGWFYHEFEVADVIAPTAQMRLRFVAQDIGPGAIIEAAVDDFAITVFECTPVASCSDGVLNQGETRIDCGGPCPACACTNNATCSDGLYCNGAETCNTFGICQPGALVVCIDGIACTTDACNEAADACAYTSNHAFCDNGQYCDGAETCSPSAGCLPGTPVTCADAIGCTVDACIEATDSCTHTPNDGDCDNGLYCDGAETCSPSAGCLSGTPVTCADAIDCTVDACDEASDACTFTPNDGDCDNGVFCDGAEFCNASLGCQSGAAPCVPLTWCDELAAACTAYGDGDFNVDGNVDLIDFASFQSCFGQPAGPACIPGNLVGPDGMVDADDLEEFTNVLTGP